MPNLWAGNALRVDTARFRNYNNMKSRNAGKAEEQCIIFLWRIATGREICS